MPQAPRVPPKRDATADGTSRPLSDPDGERFARMQPDVESESLRELRPGFWRAVGLIYNPQRQDRVRACRRSLVLPPGVEQYSGKLSVNIRSHEDVLEIVGAEVQDANVSDSSFESCIIETLPGHYSVPGAEPGKYFKITYQVVYGPSPSR